MADNVGYTPGSGAVVAADDVGGVLYQRIKPAFGTDNTAVDVSATNPLPVVDTQIAEVELLLTRMLNALNAPQGYDKSLQRQRGTNIIESGTITTVSTVTTVTTVATLTNMSTVDTLQGRIQVYGANLSAWADTVRARIT
jgi:hypothetical protein